MEFVTLLVLFELVVLLWSDEFEVLLFDGSVEFVTLLVVFELVVLLGSDEFELVLFDVSVEFVALFVLLEFVVLLGSDELVPLVDPSVVFVAFPVSYSSRF